MFICMELKLDVVCHLQLDAWMQLRVEIKDVRIQELARLSRSSSIHARRRSVSDEANVIWLVIGVNN